jgi:uncharacterized membrane protein
MAVVLVVLEVAVDSAVAVADLVEEGRVEAGDKKLIEEAIKQAETQSSCEFVAVMAQRSSNLLLKYLLPQRYRQKIAARYAKMLFNELRLDQTKRREGMMLFVSLDEHYVEIVVDQGIAQKIENQAWQDIVDDFILRVEQDRLSLGYKEAIEKSAHLLIEHFPKEGDDRDELPNHLIEV